MCLWLFLKIYINEKSFAYFEYYFISSLRHMYKLIKKDWTKFKKWYSTIPILRGSGNPKILLSRPEPDKKKINVKRDPNPTYFNPNPKFSNPNSK